MPKRKILLFILIGAAIALGVVVYACDRAVDNAAKGKLFSDAKTIPFRKVGLLLGTAKTISDGRNNLYYDHRIAAAVALFQEHKIQYLVISGDNGRKTYNEPETMRHDLVLAGIDSSLIYLDYAGFRTFDSVVRLREIFSQDSVTIISQQFHNERAIFIAEKEGISAIGFNAQGVGKRYGFKTNLREKLARVKVFADYLFGVEPKFLGEKIAIPAR